MSDDVVSALIATLNTVSRSNKRPAFGAIFLLNNVSYLNTYLVDQPRPVERDIALHECVRFMRLWDAVVGVLHNAGRKAGGGCTFMRSDLLTPGTNWVRLAQLVADYPEVLEVTPGHMPCPQEVYFFPELRSNCAYEA